MCVFFRLEGLTKMSEFWSVHGGTGSWNLETCDCGSGQRMRIPGPAFRFPILTCASVDIGCTAVSSNCKLIPYLYSAFFTLTVMCKDLQGSHGTDTKCSMHTMACTTPKSKQRSVADGAERRRFTPAAMPPHLYLSHPPARVSWLSR